MSRALGRARANRSRADLTASSTPPFSDLLVAWWDPAFQNNTIVSGELDTIVTRKGTAPALIAPAAVNRVAIGTRNGRRVASTVSLSNKFLRAAAFGLATYSIAMARQGSTSVAYLWSRDNGGVDCDYLYADVGSTILCNRGGTVSSYNVSAGWGNNAAWRAIIGTYDGTHAGQTIMQNESFLSLTSVSAGTPSGSTSKTFSPHALASTGATIPTGGYGDVLIYPPLTTAQQIAVSRWLNHRFAMY